MEHVREAFAELVGPSGRELAGNLDYGALLIAAAIDQAVDTDHELRRLDELAASCRVTSLPELSLTLFGGTRPNPDRHFLGNTSDYYDPENSLLPRVLDRRLGIPISLSVLLLAIARRCNIEAYGVGMPGHFLVGDGEQFVDAFHSGTVMDAQGCAQLFQRLAGEGAPLPAGALDRTPPVIILQRMLNNLSAIASHRSDRAMLLAVRALMTLFPTGGYREHVQHAYAAAALAQYGEAANAAERAMESVPDQLRGRLQSQADAWRSQLN